MLFTSPTLHAFLYVYETTPSLFIYWCSSYGSNQYAIFFQGVRKGYMENFPTDNRRNEGDKKTNKNKNFAIIYSENIAQNKNLSIFPIKKACHQEHLFQGMSARQFFPRTHRIYFKHNP